MSPLWKWPRRKRQELSSQSERSFRVSGSEELNWTVTGRNGHQTLIVLCPDGYSFSFPHDHPNFKAAEELARVQKERESEPYRKLFDVEESVRDLFGVITDRVRVSEGVVYFDDKPQHNTVSEQILRFMEEGIDNYLPLAKFMEKIGAIPVTM